MTRNAARFLKGQSVYKCRTCGRSTRQTGNGDNDMVQLCVQCYDLAGEENHLSDNCGEFYSSPIEVLDNISDITEKGGDASCWDDLKAKALAQYNPEGGAPAVVSASSSQTAKIQTSFNSESKIMSTITIKNVSKDNIASLKMAELVSLYNAHAKKPVAKFADRKSAESRTLNLAADIAGGSQAPAPKAEKKAAPAKKVAAEKPAKAPKAEKTPKAPKEAVSRSDAIAKSWTNPATAAKRAERSHVVVDKVEYRSVLQAFEELGLDVKKHIAFRGQLKKAEGGKLAFAGKVFKIVKAKEE